MGFRSLGEDAGTEWGAREEREVMARQKVQGADPLDPGALAQDLVLPLQQVESSLGIGFSCLPSF